MISIHREGLHIDEREKMHLRSIQNALAFKIKRPCV